MSRTAIIVMAVGLMLAGCESWKAPRVEAPDAKDGGFGPVGMNSFNHYAYGAVLGWMYRNIAGIAADPAHPGFGNIIMRPLPDKRLGSAKAEYRSAAGLVTSAWRYEGEKWIWDFTVPAGATASVTLPGETVAKTYVAGSHHIEKSVGRGTR